MATIVTRSGKGSPLTNTEVDSNFTNLNTDKIEDAPSDGTTYARQSGAWAAVTAAAATITTSSTAPSSPSDGDVWYSESNGVTYVYYDDGTSSQWVATGAPVSSPKGASSLAELSDVTLSNLATGDFLEYNGSAWVNQQPRFAQFAGSATSASGSTTNTYATSFTESYNSGSWVTDSSGVFSFSETGKWVVRLSSTLYFSSSSNNTLYSRIEKSTNSGSSFSTVTATGLTAIRYSSTGTQTNDEFYVFDVTNTSTNRLRIGVGWQYSNSSSTITPLVTFEKPFGL